MIFGAYTQMPASQGFAAKEIAERYGVAVDEVEKIGDWMKNEWETDYPMMNCAQMSDHALMFYDWLNDDASDVSDSVEWEEMVSEVAFAVEEGRLWLTA